MTNQLPWTNFVERFSALELCSEGVVYKNSNKKFTIAVETVLRLSCSGLLTTGSIRYFWLKVQWRLVAIGISNDLVLISDMNYNPSHKRCSKFCKSFF